MKTRIMEIKATIKAEDEPTTREIAASLERAVDAWVGWWQAKKTGNLKAAIRVYDKKQKSRAHAK